MISILDNLDPKEKEMILSKSTVVTYQKNDQIFEIGDVPQYLYVLNSGLVYVCDISKEGNRNILTMMSEPGDCFGEVYLFVGIDYPYEAVAMAKTEVIQIPIAVFEESKQLSTNMNVILANKAFTLSKKLQLLMQDSLEDKVIHYVSNARNVKMKRYELADYFGVSRPALSRTINKMMDDGIITIDDDGFLQMVT